MSLDLELAQQSLDAHSALGSTLVLSSRHAGWTSLLVDHHRVDLRGDATIETVATPDQTIVVQMIGQQSIEVFDHGRWRPAAYQAGTVGLTPAGQVDRLRRVSNVNKSPFEKLNLYIPAAVLNATWDRLQPTGHGTSISALNSLAFADPLIWNTAAALRRAAEEGAPDLYAACAGQWLAMHLLTRHGRSPTGVESRYLEAITDARLARTLDMMSARLAEPLTLDELAAEAGISRFHFVRCFRERTGQTPVAALQAMRIEAAQVLLDGTDLDLGSIASRCGFASAKALSNAFRRTLSIAPGQWRARQRRWPKPPALRLQPS